MTSLHLPSAPAALAPARAPGLPRPVPALLHPWPQAEVTSRRYAEGGMIQEYGPVLPKKKTDYSQIYYSSRPPQVEWSSAGPSSGVTRLCSATSPR